MHCYVLGRALAHVPQATQHPQHVAGVNRIGTRRQRQPQQHLVGCLRGLHYLQLLQHGGGATWRRKGLEMLFAV